MTNPTNPNEKDPRLTTIDAETGETVSDPFVATADVIALLRLRARQLDSAA